MHVTGTVPIAASPEKVWPYLTEPAKVMEWFTNVKRFDWEGDPGINTPFYWEEEANGKVYKLHFETTAWEPNRDFTFTMTSGDFFKSYRGRWTLTPTAEGCEFGFEDLIEFPWGPLGMVIGVFAARSSRKTGAVIMADLKRLAEDS